MPAKREADNVHGFHTQHIHVQKGHLCKTGQPTANTATVQKSRARMDWSSLISWGGAGGTKTKLSAYSCKRNWPESPT